MSASSSTPPTELDSDSQHSPRTPRRGPADVVEISESDEETSTGHNNFNPAGSSSSVAGPPRGPEGDRLALWFVVELKGDQTAWVRVGDAEERVLSAALSRTLSKVPQRKGVDVSLDVYDELRSEVEVGGIKLDGLRCIPLDCNTAQALPAKLCCSGLSARHLPTRCSSGRRRCAGAVLMRSKSIVEQLVNSHHPTAYKIGISCNPLMRWRSYEREGYANMYLVDCSEEAGWIQMLEAALIFMFKGKRGCQNIAAGGEGPVGRAPFFVYVALDPVPR